LDALTERKYILIKDNIPGDIHTPFIDVKTLEALVENVVS
jgi:hypothetical protein